MSAGFFVAGKPIAQGSKTGYPVKGKDGRTHVSMVDTAKGLKPWRAKVKAGAKAAGLTPLAGPVGMDLTFFMQRPLHHFTGGKRDRPIKLTSPQFPCNRTGDIDKLSRAILDAIDGIAYLDDCQVVSFGIGPRKVYGPEPGVTIHVYPLTEETT